MARTEIAAECWGARIALARSLGPASTPLQPTGRVAWRRCNRDPDAAQEIVLKVMHRFALAEKGGRFRYTEAIAGQYRMQGNNEVVMPVDEQRIKALETELESLKKELELCNDARRQVLKRHEGGLGQFRGWVPGCSELEQDVANVSSELGRARSGEPSSPKFKLPSSDLSKPPPYLSPDSQKLYDQIKNRMGVGGQLPYWVIGAVTETSVSALLKGTIHQEVSDFLKDNGANLNDSERSYWERVQVSTGPPYTGAP